MNKSLAFKKQLALAYKAYKLAMQGSVFYGDMLSLEYIRDHKIRVKHYKRVWYI